MLLAHTSPQPTSPTSSRYDPWDSKIAGDGPYWSHQATFEASPICASQARGFVSHHLTDHRLMYLVDPVQLVVSELATNALVHAQTAFSVNLARSADTVLLTVRDDSLSLPARRAAQATDSTGRGLEIVDIVSRDWGTKTVRNGSNAIWTKAIWASFAIRGPREF